MMVLHLPHLVTRTQRAVRKKKSCASYVEKLFITLMTAMKKKLLTCQNYKIVALKKRQESTMTASF